MKVPNEAKLLHGLCHIEYSAIIAYTSTLIQFHGEYDWQFFEDLSGIIEDEGNHCDQLASFLKDTYNVEYGSLPVHSAILDGLTATSTNLAERLLVIPHLIHNLIGKQPYSMDKQFVALYNEGKGVDAGPRLLERFSPMKDHYELLYKIVKDEDRHVEIGRKWFLTLCDQNGLNPMNVAEEFVKRLALTHPPASLKAFLSSF